MIVTTTMITLVAQVVLLAKDQAKVSTRVQTVVTFSVEVLQEAME
jgi:hypothetical protein